jgi:phage tail-like protein
MVDLSLGTGNVKTRLFDMLQTHRFWLLDLVPSSVFPFFVLGSPMYGFASISAPEITLETREIVQLNSMWKQHAYSGGACGAITLTRGARYNDDTFYDWTKRAMRGSDQVKRTLLLIHYTGLNAGQVAYSAYKANNAGTSKTASDFSIDLPAPLDTWESALQIPGRCWILWGCLPTRYKAGSDFDATSAEVSMMELELQPHAVEEIVLGPTRLDVPAAAVAVGMGAAKLLKR